MSIFSTILEKLGLKKETPAAPPPAPEPAVSAPKPVVAAPKPAASAPKPAMGAPKPAAPKPVVATPKPAAPKSEPSTVKMPQMHTPEATVSSQKTEAPVVVEAKPEAVSVVDVYAKLEGMAAKLGTPSNWKTSISDLLFLLGMDHSYKARKELAVELGCPENLMDDSVKMNTWLHKTVLTQIAQNGGNLPKELLDN